MEKIGKSFKKNIPFSRLEPGTPQHPRVSFGPLMIIANIYQKLYYDKARTCALIIFTASSDIDYKK